MRVGRFLLIEGCRNISVQQGREGMVAGMAPHCDVWGGGVRRWLVLMVAGRKWECEVVAGTAPTMMVGV